ncbi:16S rRNA (cytosine(1402)-N(4))-methyltransferase [Microgenomates group bacterium RBG_16_45_19]|nr:MAG: 16S rRNA (cytosine(1402)-N(4))-methyltransferase [Microgenomates group bacterium RBG_16_45_19]
MNPEHQPVLLEAVITGLNVTPGQLYLDATVGLGGHTQAILKRGAAVIGLDRDPQTLTRLAEALPDPQLTLIEGNFSQMSDLVRQVTSQPLAGILMDLGVSRYQLAEPSYGLSFQVDAPLDMRLDPHLTVNARDLVNGLSQKELTHLFRLYANEPQAAAMARAIGFKRRFAPIQRTGELAELIASVNPRRGKLHPATKVFQALRLAVNHELDHLTAALPQTVDLLQPHGRLAVISFHEGEDRLVKQFMKHESHFNILTKKPIIPTAAEIAANPPSRSAKLRLVEKL